jgi:tetratricopeptide (TPR) repeat protein
MSFPIFSENLQYLEPLASEVVFQNHWSFLNSLAKAYLNDNYDSRKALKYFKIAEKLAKKVQGFEKTFHWGTFGKCYENKEKYRKACDCYALEMRQRQVDSYFLESYAWCLLKDGQYERSLEMLEEVFKVSPNNGWAYGKMGYCHKQLKDYTLAIDYFEKGLKFGSYEKVWLTASIGDCYEQLNNAEKFLEYALKCEAIDNTYCWNLHNLGWHFFKTGDFQTAETYLLKVIDLEQKYRTVDFAPYACMNYGHIKLAQTQSNEEAIIFYKKGMDLYKKKKDRQSFVDDFITDQEILKGFGISEELFTNLWETLKALLIHPS